MRIAILGAHGQLGFAFAQHWQDQALALGRDQADLARPDSLLAALKPFQPDVVLNCASYNHVDQAEADPEAAFAVNAFGVRRLAQLCADLDCVLVHYSTNYVFGLERSRRHPYHEEDDAGPVSAYGASKLAGELFVRGLCPRHFILRTTGLFGPRGPNSRGSCFVDSVLRWAGEGKPLRIVNDQVCTPTFTRDLVQATLSLLDSGRYGLYQVTAGGACSWHEFASAILRRAGLALMPTPVSSREFAAPAQRPSYSVLSTRKYLEATDAPVRSWQEGLDAYLQERGWLAAPTRKAG